MAEGFVGRGLVEGMGIAHPFGSLLPGMLQDDEMARHFTAGFDDVLAPAAGVFDSLDAYVDPTLAPDDFVDWLGGWLGLAFDETWPAERRRRLVRSAMEEHRWRGTRRSVVGLVREHTGVEPEMVEPGGTSWSPTPGGVPAGHDGHEVTVSVAVPDDVVVNPDRLAELIREVVPAHLALTVSVTWGRRPDDTAGGAPARKAAKATKAAPAAKAARKKPAAKASPPRHGGAGTAAAGKGTAPPDEAAPPTEATPAEAIENPTPPQPDGAGDPAGAADEAGTGEETGA